jgi:hypothetical protein
MSVCLSVGKPNTSTATRFACPLQILAQQYSPVIIAAYLPIFTLSLATSVLVVVYFQPNQPINQPNNSIHQDHHTKSVGITFQPNASHTDMVNSGSSLYSNKKNKPNKRKKFHDKDKYYNCTFLMMGKKDGGLED